MAESTGMDATTIHSALGWIPGQGPTKDEIEADLLVVDETSMANLELLVTLLRAVGPEMHVVLVGDADQLAPVGAGKPFAELVETRAVPVAELTHIFRQAAGSMIVRGAHAVKRGEPPSFEVSEGLRRDLFLIERDDPRAALDEIASLVTQRLPQHYGVDPLTDIQVFAPVYKGALGIDAINTRLRHALNARGEPVLGGRLRIGDKLMLSGRNLHDVGLMNGTMLRLLEHRDEKLMVSADGLLVELPEEEAPRLQLAYACSIHKGQGIELPVAIVIAHPAAGPYFLRREMLYTAMTRAKVATLVIGQRQIVARAAATPDTSRRFSRLGVRLAAGDGTCPPRRRARAPLGRAVRHRRGGGGRHRRRPLRPARRDRAGPRSRAALGAAGRGGNPRHPRPGPGRSPGGRSAAARLRRLKWRYRTRRPSAAPWSSTRSPTACSARTSRWPGRSPTAATSCGTRRPAAGGR